MLVVTRVLGIGEEPGGVLLVIEHPGIELESEEATDRAHHPFGVVEEVFVAEFPIPVRAQSLSGAMAPGDPEPPMKCAFGDIARPLVPIQVGEHNIPAVPHQVHEPGLGEELGDRLDEGDVERRLVPVEGFAPAPGVEVEHHPDRIGEGRHPPLLEASPNLVFGEAETAEVGHSV